MRSLAFVGVVLPTSCEFAGSMESTEAILRTDDPLGDSYPVEVSVKGKAELDMNFV
ncbi:MAG: hypothetical protein ACO1NQ_01685 [Flavobacteriales bacterium]